MRKLSLPPAPAHPCLPCPTTVPLPPPSIHPTHADPAPCANCATSPPPAPAVTCSPITPPLSLPPTHPPTHPVHPRPPSPSQTRPSALCTTHLQALPFPAHARLEVLGGGGSRAGGGSRIDRRGGGRRSSPRALLAPPPLIVLPLALGALGASQQRLQVGGWVGGWVRECGWVIVAPRGASCGLGGRASTQGRRERERRKERTEACAPAGLPACA